MLKVLAPSEQVSAGGKPLYFFVRRVLIEVHVNGILGVPSCGAKLEGEEDAALLDGCVRERNMPQVCDCAGSCRSAVYATGV